MSTVEADRTAAETLPDHMQLPETDGSIVENYLEHPQGALLSEPLLPVLRRKHPDGQFALGRDCGIYWKPTDPPLSGVTAPDWFYVPDVPPTLDGHYRRSYVLWKELVAPLIVLEFASGNGSVERDRTPHSGKFWIYERVIRPGYYGIFHVEPGEIEIYQMIGNHFQAMTPNARGHYPIASLEVELGVWYGMVENYEFPWMRWYDSEGTILPTGRDLADIEARRAETEARRAETEARRADEEARRADDAASRADEEARRADDAAGRADRLAAKLRALGIDPEA